MNVIDALGTQNVVQAIAWALLHFLWQGVIIAGVAWIALLLLVRAAPTVRYVVCTLALSLCAIAPIATFIVVLDAQGAEALRAVLPGAITTDAVPSAMGWVTLVWLAGAVLLQTRLVYLWIRAHRLERQGVSEAPAHWVEKLDELRARLGIRRSVRLLESSLADVPAVVGSLRPVVLVPIGMLTQLEPEQVHSILAHELAHVRRHDFIVNLVQSVVEALLFYHPCVWWLSSRMRQEREYCCDDIAVQACGDPVQYARALTTLEHTRIANPALASNGGPLMKRITRLVGAGQPHRSVFGATRVAPLAAGLLVTLSASAMGLSFVMPVEHAALPNVADVKPPRDQPATRSHHSLADKHDDILGELLAGRITRSEAKYMLLELKHDTVPAPTAPAWSYPRLPRHAPLADEAPAGPRPPSAAPAPSHPQAVEKLHRYLMDRARQLAQAPVDVSADADLDLVQRQYAELLTRERSAPTLPHSKADGARREAESFLAKRPEVLREYQRLLMERGLNEARERIARQPAPERLLPSPRLPGMDTPPEPDAGAKERLHRALMDGLISKRHLHEAEVHRRALAERSREMLETMRDSDFDDTARVKHHIHELLDMLRALEARDDLLAPLPEPSLLPRAPRDSQPRETLPSRETPVDGGTR